MGTHDDLTDHVNWRDRQGNSQELGGGSKLSRPQIHVDEDDKSRNI